MVISIQLGPEVTSVSATASGDTRGILPGGGKNPNYPVGALGGGSWDFDPNKGVLRWMISALTANEKAASLVGSFVCRWVLHVSLRPNGRVLTHVWLSSDTTARRRCPARTLHSK